MACIVPRCSNRMGNLKGNNEKLSFHRFPADIELRNIWIKNVRKGDTWTPSQHTRICSAHFEDSCYREGYERRVLYSHAVPTLFPNMPSSCRPKLPARRKLVAKYIDAVPSTSLDLKNYLHGTLPKSERVESKNRSTQTDKIDTNKDIEWELMKAKKLAQHYKTLAIRRRRKLKATQRRCDRLLKKKEDLEAIIQLLCGDTK